MLYENTSNAKRRNKRITLPEVYLKLALKCNVEYFRGHLVNPALQNQMHYRTTNNCTVVKPLLTPNLTYSKQTRIKKYPHEAILHEPTDKAMFLY